MKRILEKYGYMIDSLEKEYDFDEHKNTYWCYLKDEYEYDGCHTIHENTLKEVAEKLKIIER